MHWLWHMEGVASKGCGTDNIVFYVIQSFLKEQMEAKQRAKREAKEKVEREEREEELRLATERRRQQEEYRRDVQKASRKEVRHALDTCNMHWMHVTHKCVKMYFYTCSCHI